MYKNLIQSLLAIAATTSLAAAAEKSPHTDWLMEARVGAFMHFLPDPGNGAALVEAFDVDALADQLESMGARYFVFTLGQNSGWINAPNATYDRVTGFKAGERCATRDLPADLHEALAAKGIRLMLYLPCQTPNRDVKAQKAFGLAQGPRDQPIDVEFAQRWAGVIQEWSERYGDKVSGWWFDGGYKRRVGFNDDVAHVYANAVRKGNPEAIVTFNPGLEFIRHTEAEDYTAGEVITPFAVVPKSRWVDGSQWHVLTFLGKRWGSRETRLPTERWATWFKEVAANGGAVTFDMGPNLDPELGPVGTFSKEQADQFRKISQQVEGMPNPGRASGKPEPDTTDVNRSAAAEGTVTMTLQTKPAQVRAGQPFDMVWRVSAGDAQVLKVFLDTTDAFGPEHTWEHAGDGVFEATLTHLEETPGFKEYELWAKLKRGESSRFVGETFQINVENAEGDRDLAAFLDWMKQVGYSDEIIQIHAYDGTKPVVRESWKKYFDMQKGDLGYRDLKTMPIVFVDVLATEDQATNELMKGETGALETYLTHMFGKPFGVRYEQVSIPYQNEFGEPALQSNAEGDKWLKFDPLRQGKYARELAARITEERNLPRNAVIIRWAARKWNYKEDVMKIQDQTGSGPANSAASFNGFGLGLYAHEWGHGLGLGHMFVNGPGSYSSRIWGLECIMNHSYVGYANRETGRLLSPLARYVLEPKNGYADQAAFAAEYNQAMAGTDLLKRRLEEARTQATVANTMAWSTPWTPGSGDSVICRGLQNSGYEIQELKLLPGIKPGTYSLLAGTTGSAKVPRSLILKRGGETIASVPFGLGIKISKKDPQTITIDNYLSLVIGKSGRGSSNLFGIGELLNEKPLVVQPESRLED